MKYIQTVNGVIVQAIQNLHIKQKEIPYHGIARYFSWPLSNRVEELSKKITKEMEERWFNFYSGDEFALAVVPSRYFARKYIDICNTFNVQTRILLIESNRKKPVWEGRKDNTITLGYDYATSQDFFSSIYDDLFGSEIIAPLEKYKNMLNDNGLFDNENDLASYIYDRKQSIINGYNLEPHGDFCMFNVSLIVDSTSI